MLLCIFLTLYIAIACYVAARYILAMRETEAILAALTMSCAQVILSELGLGLVGLLQKELLLTSNLIISTITIVFALRSPGRRGIGRETFDSIKAKVELSGVSDGYNQVLLLLIIFSYTIIITASFLLPPRGIDDMGYHLPVISEYARAHTIKLLPVQIREAFAYPQNAELLFLWPLLFAGSLKLIDCVNVLFVFLSVLAVYALLRNFKVSARDALFYAMLYALCPVVMMQAGSNYIDVILTLFLILSLYFTILFLQQGRNCQAWCAALSIGMTCGMKYTALFLTFPLQALIIRQLFQGKRRQAFGFVVTVCLLGGYWYFRNAIVLGNPLYPMNPLVSGMGFMEGSGQSNAVMDILANVHDWLLLFPLVDIGVGTFDGGFGPVFWGLGFPSWICIFFLTILKFQRKDLPKLIALLLLPTGFLLLLLVPKQSWLFNGRYALFIVPIGLLSLSLIPELVKAHVYRNMLKTFCIIFSAATVCLLATTKKPSYRFDTVLLSPFRGHIPSEYLFPLNTVPDYETLKHVWYPLDYLTRDDRPGIDCYIASNTVYYEIAPIYGSNLQNNPIVVGEDVPPHPEAFIYLHSPRKDLSELADQKEFYYPKTEITLEETLSNPEYSVVTSTKLGYLIMSRAYLGKPGKADRLRTYYAASWPDAVKDAARITPLLEPGIPLVTADEIVYGLLHAALGQERMEKVIMVPAGYEQFVAKAQRLSACYTLSEPLPGYTHTIIDTVKFNDRSITVFLNCEKRNEPNTKS